MRVKKLLPKLILILLLAPALLYSQTYNTTDGSLLVSNSMFTGVWSCDLDAVTTLKKCQTAPGAGRNYITSITIQSTTALPGLFLIEAGTGTDCATSTVAMYPAQPGAHLARFGYPGNGGSPLFIQVVLGTPSTLQDICISCSAVNTCAVHLGGITGPN